jgi:hypothetical protein
VLPDGFATRCRSVLCRGGDPHGWWLDWRVKNRHWLVSWR